MEARGVYGVERRLMELKMKTLTGKQIEGNLGR
jgi:hypothetical protein